MRVRMKIKIGGTRDGVEWPDKGDTVDLPDHQAADLVANGYAEEVRHEAVAARSDAPAVVEPAAESARTPAARTGRKRKQS